MRRNNGYPPQGGPQDWPPDYYEQEPYRELDMRPGSRQPKERGSRSRQGSGLSKGQVLYSICVLFALIWVDYQLDSTGVIPGGIWGMITHPGVTWQLLVG